MSNFCKNQREQSKPFPGVEKSGTNKMFITAPANQNYAPRLIEKNIKRPRCDIKEEILTLPEIQKFLKKGGPRFSKSSDDVKVIIEIVKKNKAWANSSFFSGCKSDVDYYKKLQTQISEIKRPGNKRRKMPTQSDLFDTQSTP